MINLQCEPSGKAFVYGDTNLELPTRHSHQSIVKVLTAVMATQLDLRRTYPYRYWAAVLMDARRENEAISELSKAIAFKTDLQLLHLRGAFHESIGDTEAAVHDYQAALSVDPNHGDTIELYNRACGRQ